MIKAAKGFRRLKAHKQLPSLRAAFRARQTRCATRLGQILTTTGRLHSLLISDARRAFFNIGREIPAKSLQKMQ